MKRKLAVLHWMPVEMYPPAMNLARHFQDTGRWEVTVHTTEDSHGLAPFAHPGVAVHRSPSAAGENALLRAKAYGHYHLGSFARLARDRPDLILYVEPQSSFPAFLHAWSRPDTPVFVHHHEYHEPEQFLRPGMALARWFHRLEAWRLFPRARWVSHTNTERLARFLGDHPEIDPGAGRVLPNLPPASWFGAPNEAWQGERAQPLRMVYVGSLSRKDTYIEELINWTRRQDPGAVTLDVYAYNLDDDTRDFLEANQRDGVRFFSSGIAYDDLPSVLRKYHTGVILYRANTTNYRYNASNKLFEYLACGLDVVFPDTMLGVKPYTRMGTWPRVIETRFDDGSGPDLDFLRDRGEIPAGTSSEGNAETVFEELEQAMLAVLSHAQVHAALDQPGEASAGDRGFM